MTRKDFEKSLALVDAGVIDLRGLEAAHTGLWQWDVASDIVHLSPLAGNLIGATDLSPLLGQFLTWLHPDDRLGLGEALRNSVAKGIDLDLDFSHFFFGRPVRLDSHARIGFCKFRRTGRSAWHNDRYRGTKSSGGGQ